ncbi:MAG: RagB/SusD family nutrient uptake outer membrane protein [Candidatus Pseudobacter hemicellulosilyticus]|uniref:RagB/SusD family nutrient uptake outer membrane protein n=1 Tax=Candidatus Pseudobacter hemicellulosilyticus TaxID=3121375 RepID=A0AAJ5WQS3_9BACT|nr:MAG: RagB/SusD family nutrient uptake outer membrane protein [Pseudobacter sp.]
MKSISTYILLFGCLLTMGCKKWLDVKPEGLSTSDELFASQKGFRDALTGAYIRMKEGDIYGGGLTWGFVEYMACNWELATNSGNTALPRLMAGDYTHATVREWMDNIYIDLYKVVADVNSLLAAIDEKKTVFTDGNYELTKGEALALRAFCHFDVLRLFGPMPQAPGTDPLFPYVKEVSKNIHEPLDYAAFTRQLLADLGEAENLLKDVDPFRTWSMAELNPAQNATPVLRDNYLLYRQVRMNYYAVLALKARVYMWLAAQDPSLQGEAARAAQLVIDAKDHNGLPTFRLGNEGDRVAGDYTMSPEHLMAVSIYNLEPMANGLFTENGSYFRYDFNVQDGFWYLNNLFPVNERTSDVRWKEMWSYKIGNGLTNYVMYRKFLQRTGNPVLQSPLLRLSEMYLVLTECAATKTEAEGYYSTYCAAKGIPFVNGFGTGDWLADRRNKLIREYVREFYAEGQTFFNYKRMNVVALPASWTYTQFTGRQERYVVPKPLREIDYNNK